MGETSLARQLKKLAVPQTSILLQDKVKASLLFDPREASTIDRDTFFAIGATGLEQLQNLEPEFSVFESTLFNESSKMLERSVQTAEINAKLDKNIHHFLTMVSPYFLLKPSHKALEWLIHRFHIHMFNVDSIMSCILPYHETRTFARAVQLLDLSNPASRWHWLEPLQKPGIPLPKSTLINHCHKDLGFMRFICELVPEMIKVYGKNNPSILRLVISFYTCAVLEVLEDGDKITENMIITVLPYILKGLRSNILDYCAASYMIIGQLARNAKLIPSLLKKLTTKIVKNLIPGFVNEGVMCVVVIYEYQNIKQLPKLAFAKLCTEPEFKKILEEFSTEYHITSFVSSLLRKLIPTALRQTIKKNRVTDKKGKKLQLLEHVLKILSLDEDSVYLAVKILINQYIKLKDGSQSEVLQNLHNTCGPLLRLLERRYPEYFDKTLTSLLSTKLSNYSDDVNNLINSPLSDSELQTDGDAGLFLNISHPNPSVRLLALDALVTIFNEDKIKDLDLVKDAIIARIADDDPSVVNKVLDIKELLLHCVPHDCLFTALCTLLKKETKNKSKSWWRAKIKALDILVQLDSLLDIDAFHSSLLLIILPYLLPLKFEAIHKIKSVFNSCVIKKFPVLEKIKKECSILLTIDTSQSIDINMLTNLNCSVLISLGDFLISSDKNERDKMVQALIRVVKEESSNTSLNFIAIYLLQLAVVKESTPQEKLSFAHEVVYLCQHILTTSKLFPFEEDKNITLADIMPFSIKALAKSQFPTGLIIFTLRNIISCITDGCSFSDDKWWLKLSGWPNNQHYRLLLSLFKIITEQENVIEGKSKHAFQQLLAIFFKFQLPSLKEMLTFLSSIWLQTPNETENLISSVLQLRALCIASTVCENPQEILNWVFEENSTLIPSLLAATISCQEPIREKALLCLHNMVTNVKVNKGLYKELCKIVCSHAEEIQADANQLPEMLKEWLLESLNKSEIIRKTRSGVGQVLNQESSVLQQILHLVTDSETPFCIKHAILVVLQKTDTEKILSTLLPVLSSSLASYKEKFGLEDITIIELILAKYTPSTAPVLSSINSKEFIVFRTALSMIIKKEALLDYCVHKTALGQLTVEFFNAIPSSQVQQNLIKTLLDLYVDSENAEIGNKMLKVLKKLCRDASLLLKEFQQFEIPTRKTVREAKKQRISQTSAPISDLDDEKLWKRIVILLEIIQNKKTLRDKKLLIPPLFNLLKRSLDMENNPSTEYTRQVILSCLFNFCKSSTNEGDPIDENKFQVELVVHCIRMSDNPQTQYHSLLLLNWAATLFPEHVLHNIMAIFTFMGTSLVRLDDSYSFQIIYQTVETIIPALLKASHQKDYSETLRVVASVTRVFVDAFPDIPRHRQIPLFIKLITTLGPSDFLWLPLVQIMDSYVFKTHENVEHDKNKQTTDSQLHPLIEFSISLCNQFSPEIQVKVFLQLMEFLLTLPFEKGDSVKSKLQMKENVIKELFDISYHTDKQLKHFRYAAVGFMSGILSSPPFIGKLADLSLEESQHMEHLYQTGFESILQYILQVIQLMQKYALQPTGKFWKIHLHKLYDLLDKLNSIMPSNQFISVITGLMANKTPSIRRKAMDMLNAKLMHHPTFFTSDQVPALLSLVRPLLRIVKKKQAMLDLQSEPETSGDEGDDIIVNRQNAMLSLKLLCRMFGKENPDKFVKVLEVIVRILSRTPVHHHLTGNTVLCLAELCHCLRAHAVPYLNDFVPPLIEILKDEEKLNSNELLLVSVLTAIQRLVENLAAFLSSYLESLLIRVCILSAFHLDASREKSPSYKRLKAVHTHLSGEIEPRVLFPAIEKCYMELLETNQKAIGPLMTILSEKVSTMDKSDINAYFSQLQNFFLISLDFRTQQSQKCQNVEEVEEQIISALLTLVLKLTETTFRPMFFKLYDWATRTEQEKEKILTFYHLCDNLAEKLKSLFVLFGGHFVKNAATLLDLNNSSKTDEKYFGNDSLAADKSCCLLQYLLNTLYKCFLYGSESFMDKERFNTLMQPLVDQIENLQGSDESYQIRIANYLTPCIAQLAVAAGDDALWKTLNFQILLKTRKSSPKVRFAALQVIREVVKKLGDDYLVILPESIPFLAELMEDESFEVEQECQSVIADMEKVLGESLMKYF